MQAKALPDSRIKKMNKYKILIQYVGTKYNGWQIQKDQATVQGVIRDAIYQLTGETVSLVGAGRTDSGVHALGQIAHFKLERKLLLDRLRRSLNGVLPWDIRIMRVNLATEPFHAQRDALQKRYEYRIFNAEVLPPFLRGYVYHLPRILDFEVMQAAASKLIGSHDFKGFAAKASRIKDSTREIFLSRVLKKGRHITYQVEGNGFLHHMVRNFVGTLVEVGRNQRSARDIVRILQSRDRQLAGPTAPPQGLYLMKVWY